MAGPVLTQSLTVLFRNFDTAFPNRDHATDGWIGDAAHQQYTSGHNPDDTAGVKAEYSDADTKPEVRAIDVDKDLRYSGVTMQNVIDRILATPNDVKRLMYIIYNRIIWSRSSGWLPRTYTGSSPHIEHAHFSGDPAYDEDGSDWVVAKMGEGTEMELSTVVPGTDNPKRTVGDILADLENMRNWLLAASTAPPGPGSPSSTSREGLLMTRVASIETRVDGLMTKEQADALLLAVANLTTAVESSTGAAGNYDAVLTRKPE